MKTNGSKPTGRIRDTQTTREDAAATLKMLRANLLKLRNAIADGGPSAPAAAAATPTFLATEAICAHLADVAGAIREQRRSWEQYHDALGNLGDRLGDLDIRVGETSDEIDISDRLNNLEKRLERVERAPAIDV